VEVQAYLSLGSNLGDRQAHLRQAIAQLERAGEVTAVSSLYETEPVDVAEQPWFMNCAVALQTQLAPRVLLDTLLAIEQKMGRMRTHPKGPRLIDIDILFFDDRIVNEDGLTIPHPQMHARRFVLEPLAQIASQARHPVLAKTVRELLEGLPAGQGVRRLQEAQSPKPKA
jgi:2-amino-4-hydroxy-6-hydroxymethyldihydropteridine diphosphokinase